MRINRESRPALWLILTAVILIVVAAAIYAESWVWAAGLAAFFGSLIVAAGVYGRRMLL